MAYVVIPLAGAVRMFAVLAPNGSIVSEHQSWSAALEKARRTNENNAKQHAKEALWDADSSWMEKGS